MNDLLQHQLFMPQPEIRSCISRQLVLLENNSFVRDEEFLAGVALVLATDEVRDLLILGLFDGRLVVLWSLAHHSFLDEVNT